jgi:hypothetical protein
MAWVYKTYGMEQEFRWHVEGILENNIGLERNVVVPNAAFIFCHLAATFALTEQREKMYVCLDKILQQESVLIDVIRQIILAPHFDNYRHEAAFGELLNAIQKKYNSVKRSCKILFNGWD